MDPLQHVEQPNLEAAIHQLNNRLLQLEHQGPAAAVHSNVKPKSPSTFDGVSNRDTETWLYEVEKYFQATNTIDPQCVIIVATFIKGTALQWWKREEEHRTHQQRHVSLRGRSSVRCSYIGSNQSKQRRLLVPFFRPSGSISQWPSIVLAL